MTKVVKGFDPSMQAQAEALLAGATSVESGAAGQSDSEMMSAQVSASNVQKIIDRSAQIPKIRWDDQDIGGLRVIRDWVTELKQVIDNNADSQNVGEGLASIGRAAIFATSNGRDAVCIAHSMAETLGVPFAYLSAEDLHQTAQDWLNYAGRVVVFVDPGEWHAKPGPLAELIMRAERCVFVTSTPSIENMSPELVRAQLFDRHFYMPKIPPQVEGRLWLDQLGLDICSEELLAKSDKVAQIASMLDGRSTGLALLRLRRIATRESRKLNLSDLIDVGFRGIVEADSSIGGYAAGLSIHQIAVHEAGHAIVSILESNGSQIPVHATIMGAGDVGGFVVPTLDVELRNYSQLRLKTRVALGGRAAEEVVFGSANISAGAAQDLRTIAFLSKRYFASGVFAPGMEDVQKSGSNLLVHDDDPASQAELRSMIRPWLADEYKTVVKLLQDNRAFLDAFAEQLQKDPVLDQQEILSLYAKYRTVGGA